MIQYPIEIIGDDQIQTIQSRQDLGQFALYRLGYEDVNTFPGHTLEMVALRFYGTQRMWELIYDYNPNIYPDDYQEGMTVIVPLPVTANIKPIGFSARGI